LRTTQSWPRAAVVSAIRILLAGPRMLSDLVARLLETAPDVVVAGTAPFDDRLMAAARELAVDAIVAGTSGEDPEALDAMLFELPTVKLVALAPDGRRATLFELLPRHTALGELSRDVLLGAIRDAVAVRPRRDGGG
jgi:hypothetical protein